MGREFGEWGLPYEIVRTSNNEFFYPVIFDGLKWLGDPSKESRTGTILSGLTLKPKIKVFLQSRYFVATVTCYIKKNIFNTIIFPSTVAQW